MHEDERKLRVDVLPRWGARRVGEIRRADVLRLIEDTRERGGVSSNRTLALVRVVFQYAVDREELDRPVVGADAWCGVGPVVVWCGDVAGMVRQVAARPPAPRGPAIDERQRAADLRRLAETRAAGRERPRRRSENRGNKKRRPGHPLVGAGASKATNRSPGTITKRFPRRHVRNLAAEQAARQGRATDRARRDSEAGKSRRRRAVVEPPTEPLRGALGASSPRQRCPVETATSWSNV
ncbi:MAG TPA: hypothetical protein VJA16_03125, partial [Thermoanaerobaculia bacterium]